MRESVAGKARWIARGPVVLLWAVVAVAGLFAAAVLLHEGRAEAARVPSDLWAVVGADGTLVRGKAVTGASRVGTGHYRVTFKRNVSGCAYAATLDEASPGDVSVFRTLGTNDPNPPTRRQVGVATYTPAGNRLDHPFHLIVRC